MKRLVLRGDGQAGDLSTGSVFFIGTATVLLRCAGFTILTDPNFLHRGERAGLGYGLLHATRKTDPAIELADLPPIDFVILSHHHEDHFDKRVARELARDTPIATTPGAARTLARRGFRNTIPLRMWEALDVEKGNSRLRLTAMPGTHGPGPLGRLLPQVMGSLLEFGTSAETPLVRLYISGDTLVHRRLREIPRRYPSIDLGLLHLGGTRVLGLLVTMDAKQGVEALRIVSPRTAVPIHYDDYDIFKSPLEDFQREVRRAGMEDRIRYLMRGERLTFEVPGLAQGRGVPGPDVETEHPPAP